MKHLRRFFLPAIGVSMLVVIVSTALADTAPDATDRGPLATTNAEYKFDAALDPDVLATRPTELWAVVFRPADLDNGPYPVLIFLHGNHFTCGYGENPRIDDSAQYTFLGTCPPNHVVTPNHRGYDYLADQLASWGYIVVSINANRGINAAGGPPEDLGLNLARGRLLLKHLQRLSEWNQLGGTPESLGVELQGKLDLNHVGLLGHSRGGEGVRAAYKLYSDPSDPNPVKPWKTRIGPVNFEGIFEIGPVDGQTSRVLNADGTKWNVLLPMCDGDVSNLQGVKAFDRMMLIVAENPATQKSTFTVWGANHNYYNTEWQTSDSVGCTFHDPLWSTTVGSPEQRETSLVSVMAFFRGNIGADANSDFNWNFNPQFDLPPVVTSLTRVDRGFTDSPKTSVTTVFEDFDKPTGLNTYGFANDASSITITHGPVPNHNNGDPYGRVGVQRAGAISWTAAGDNVYFQTNWKAPGDGSDVSTFRTLDLRLSRQCGEAPTAATCTRQNTLNGSDSTDFAIRLVMNDGTMSDAVQISSYTDLTGPVGGLFTDGTPNLHPILQTARIPLSDFTNVDLARIRGVRLVFNSTPKGAIFAANIRLSTLSGLTSAGLGTAAVSLPSNEVAHVVGTLRKGEITEANTVEIRSVTSAPMLGNARAVTLRFSSTVPFPASNEIMVLRSGTRDFMLSEYPEDGDPHTIVFTLTPEEFASLPDGPAVLQYGVEETVEKWLFQIDKSGLH